MELHETSANEVTIVLSGGVRTFEKNTLHITLLPVGIYAIDSKQIMCYDLRTREHYLLI